MENKYTLFKTSEGSFTVPVLAESNIFKMKFDGQELSLGASIERYFIYYLYMHNDRGEVILWLRDVGKYEWNPNKFDLFIEEFINLHPKQEALEYSYELIPMQADEHGLDLPIPHYCCTLTAKAERDLMNLFIEIPSTKVKAEMIKYFRKYCEDYGYDFSKKGKGEQFEWLYYSFLEQHGIYRYISKPLNDGEKEESRKARLDKKRKSRRPLIIFLSSSTLTLVFLAFATGINPDDHPKLVSLFSFLCLLSFGIAGNMARDYLKKHNQDFFES